MPRVLLVGAMLAETLPLSGLLRAPRPAGRRLVEGDLGPARVAVLTTGVGPRRAQARTAGALAAWRPDLVVNLGTCGALVDTLEVGAVLHADRLLDEAGERGPVRPLGQPAGAIVTVRRGVWDPQTRAALAARGALTCEMEAAAVFTACAAAGLPLSVVKVVSDHAGGAPDGVLPPTHGRPGPLAIARFTARAFGLVRRRLVPLVPEMIAAGTC